MDTTVDESLLVRRARSGDVGAFENIYRRESGRVFAVCLRLVKDRDLAEDLTQDTFVMAWQKLRDFRGDSAFGTWLYRIATNLTISDLRKRSRHAFILEEMAHSELPSPQAMERTEKMDLDAAIAELPDGARVVFVMYAILGYTHAEISQELGVAEGTSKAHLFKARRSLKQRLGLVEGPDDQNQIKHETADQISGQGKNV
ncbi:MAG: sigma-70 family RNA polymerase sigma factor [Pseudomonadota bacterium]